MARGNENLININDSSKDYGSRQLEFSIRTGTKGNITEKKVTKTNEYGTWNENFHIYTTIWNNNGFIFEVDDEEVGRLRPDGQNNIAPFDLEV